MVAVQMGGLWLKHRSRREWKLCSWLPVLFVSHSFKRRWCSHRGNVLQSAPAVAEDLKSCPDPIKDAWLDIVAKNQRAINSERTARRKSLADVACPKCL